MLIGLTGQIGSGKSSVARVFARLGATVVDADRIGREVVEDSAGLKRRLVRAFGPTIVDRRGRLRRKKLAELAFADRASSDRLNRLVHPYLLAELNRRVRTAGRSGRPVVIDAALLLHWEMDRRVDRVVVVYAPRSVRLARLKLRGVSRRDAVARERAQLSFAEFRRRADHIIRNDGSRAELVARARRLFHRLTGQTD